MVHDTDKWAAIGEHPALDFLREEAPGMMWRMWASKDTDRYDIQGQGYSRSATMSVLRLYADDAHAWPHMMVQFQRQLRGMQ